jgi:hypothetical protein
MNTIDISNSLKAKSDCLNADDLIGGAIIATIEDINYDEGRSDQPLWIYYRGCNNKPWKPCKSMRRVIAAVWGTDAGQYIGRALKLYRDETVKWAGVEVGGIRIAEMSHIDSNKTLALQITKGKKQHYLVKPLKTHAPAAPPAKPQASPEQMLQKATEVQQGLLKTIEAVISASELDGFEETHHKTLERLKKYDGLHDEVVAVLDMQRNRLGDAMQYTEGF